MFATQVIPWRGNRGVFARSFLQTSVEEHCGSAERHSLIKLRGVRSTINSNLLWKCDWISLAAGQSCGDIVIRIIVGCYGHEYLVHHLSNGLEGRIDPFEILYIGSIGDLQISIYRLVVHFKCGMPPFFQALRYCRMEWQSLRGGEGATGNIGVYFDGGFSHALLQDLLGQSTLHQLGVRVEDTLTSMVAFTYRCSRVCCQRIAAKDRVSMMRGQPWTASSTADARDASECIHFDLVASITGYLPRWSSGPVILAI